MDTPTLIKVVILKAQKQAQYKDPANLILTVVQFDFAVETLLKYIIFQNGKKPDQFFPNNLKTAADMWIADPNTSASFPFVIVR